MMTVKNIPLHRLEDLSDRSTFSYPVTAGELVATMREVGLLQPVAVMETSERLRVIFGAKRLAAARELGWTEIPACIYAELHVTDLLSMRLHQDHLQRRYNPIEKARVLRAFLDEAKLPMAQLCSGIAPKIDIPPTPEWARKYLDLLQLDEDVKLATAAGELNAAHAFMLLPFKPPDRKLIFERVIRKCQPSVGDCREILDNLFDMTVIFDQSVSFVLGNDGIRRILDAGALKSRDRCTQLRAKLRTLRFPNLSRMEADFVEARSGLAIDANVRIRPPRFFEGNYLDISFRARDEQEVRKILSGLKGAEFAGLFKIIRGES